MKAYAFGPPGLGSGIYLYGSGSGIFPSTNKQKNTKTLDYYCFVTSLRLFTFGSGSAFGIRAKMSRVGTLHERLPSKIWKLRKQMFTNYNHITSRLSKRKPGSIARIFAASATSRNFWCRSRSNSENVCLKSGKFEHHFKKTVWYANYWPTYIDFRPNTPCSLPQLAGRP